MLLMSLFKNCGTAALTLLFLIHPEMYKPGLTEAAYMTVPVAGIMMWPSIMKIVFMLEIYLATGFKSSKKFHPVSEIIITLISFGFA
jgi:hypothetical protein